MNSTTEHIESFRPVYRVAPATDILSSINISIIRISAVRAFKMFTLAFTNVVTCRTRFGRVSRWNSEYLNTFPFGFILNERLKLIKRPSVVKSSLVLAEPFIRSFTNCLQVLKGYCFVLFFGLLNYLLGNCVIDYFGGRSFTTGYSFQNLFSALRSFTLKGGSHLLSLFSKVIEFLTFISFSLGIRSDIGYSKVNAKNIVAQTLFGIRYITSGVYVPFTFDVTKIGFPLLVLKEFAMMLPCFIRNLLPSPGSPNGNLIGFPRKDPVVITDGSVFLEPSFLFSVQLIRIRNLSYTTDNHLSRKVERILNRLVFGFMEVVLTETFIIPSILGKFVTSGIRLFERIKKACFLFLGRINANLCRQLHITNVIKNSIFEKVELKSPPKGGGFLILPE